MALKIRYEKKDQIPKGAEEHYTEKDGAWVLDADYEDVTALKNAKEHEKNKRIAAEAKVTEVTGQLEEVRTELNSVREGAIPKADVEALKNSYQQKYDRDTAELNNRLAAQDAQLNGLVLGSTVDKLAGELFDKNAEIGKPHVRARLKLVNENGAQVVRVLDKEGKETAFTVDDLKKEMLQDKTFAGILVGSRGSGSGASGGSGGGGASPKKLSQMNEAERIAYQRENPAGYNAELAESKRRNY